MAVNAAAAGDASVDEELYGLLQIVAKQLAG